MKFRALVLGAACALSLFPVSESFAQGKPQTLSRLDVTAVASGYRASKIIGASVVNEANEKVGTIDDLIVSRSDRIPYAIVSVGGFLGIANKLVAVPMENLRMSPDQTIFAGATKDFLKSLPEFTYAK